MSELPTGWVSVQLGDLLTNIVGGGTPSKATASYFQGTIPFMTVKDMHSRFIEDTQDHITQEALDDSASALIPADTLVIASRMSLGKIARPRIATAINQDLKALFIHQEIQKTYVEYAWRANERRIQAMGTGTTVKGIRLEDIRGLEVPLAPSAEQVRIASLLDNLQARIIGCQRRLSNVPVLLKRFRQAVLDAGMTGVLTDSARPPHQQTLKADDVVAARLSTERGAARKKVCEFLQNHHPQPAGPDLPKGWLKTHVGVIGSVTNGSTPSRSVLEYWNGDIPWVSSGEVANNEISCTREWITDAGFENSSVRLLPIGSVLLAMIGEGKTRGQSSLLNIPACINQNVAGVVPVREVIEPKFLWYWFQRQYETTRTVGNGSGPKALNCERVRELEVFLPPLDEQKEIVLRIEALFKFADSIEARHSTATRQAQRLTTLTLAKAFRGELVQQNPQDEPASILLQRIAGNQPETLKTTRGRPRTKKPETVEILPVALPDWTTLPAGAWDAQVPADEHTATAQLTAVLKAWGKPVPQEMARLATLLCLQPRLLTVALPAEHAAQWCRLVGDAADLLPSQVVTLQPALNTPWRNATSKMRARGDLIESGSDAQGTWALGPDATRVDTAGWPEGRAGWVVHYLQAHGVEAVFPALATEVQEFVHARAA
jgi:type I restriction enzyme, S subunit